MNVVILVLMKLKRGYSINILAEKIKDLPKFSDYPKAVVSLELIVERAATVIIIVIVITNTGRMPRYVFQAPRRLNIAAMMFLMRHPF